MTKLYNFTATGSIEIDDNMMPIQDAFNNVIGFTRPDGTRVDLFIGLRILSPDEKTETYTHKDDDYASVGVTCLDYNRLDFEKF